MDPPLPPPAPDFAEATKVSIPLTLPPFYREDPRLWFIQLDAAFTGAHVNTQRARFTRTIPLLPYDVAVQAADLTQAQLVTPYDDLKQRLIEIFEPSRHARITALTEHRPLGDLKPSQLLRQMRHHLGDLTPNDILKAFWIKALPIAVQMSIAPWMDKTPEFLAPIADATHEIRSAAAVHQIEPDCNTEAVATKQPPRRNSPARNYQQNRPPSPIQQKGYVNTVNSGVTTEPTPPTFINMLAKYRPEPRSSSHLSTVKHFIETKGPPVTAKSRRLHPEQLRQTKEHFKQLINDGIIQPSKSPWASPLHAVPKPNGTWRFCGDYRRLNERTVGDQYAVPHLRDFSSHLHGCTVFSTLDISRAFHHIDVNPQDVPKTAIITPFGLYEYRKMNFGLKNAAQSWQRYMDQILRDFDFVFCFLDDVLIASRNIKEHERHVKAVLDVFAAEGLTVNKEKCVLAKNEVTCLGHIVNENGIRPVPKKVDNLTTFPLPTTVTDLRRFLGMLNFYRRHIPNAAMHQQPLVNAIPQPSKKKDRRTIEWTEQMKSAFNKCKNDLQNATTLAHPSPKGRLSITTDASDVGIGAVLQQVVDNKTSPLGFFSKTLTTAQQKYSTFDKELLAIYESVKHFRDFVEGRTFHIITDHKPLTTSLHQDRKTASPRRIRQMEFISQFTTDIRYTPGTSNVVADTLSRPSLELHELTTFPSGKEISVGQQSDESSEFRNLISTGRLEETQSSRNTSDSRSHSGEAFLASHEYRNTRIRPSMS
ncbi:hypothetical protein GE061_016600 [Apolygus lucorum]|uniref:RNA-directed DNA polymerase n=1 Tax=Apolygus lucorum TaxID=248454 RepID=A0A8S9XHT7_APOLU|nr:hypothetical protein GE061_016600 [Apolygus lucorum]